jgi:hypothetical protein
MTFQISQRGKEYLKTALTLLRAAQTMTDRVIAGQLKALADDYQRRAEKASHVDAAKASARSAASAEPSGAHDLMGSFTAHPAQEIPSDVGMPGARPSHEFFIPSLPRAELEGWSRYSRSRWNDYCHLMAGSFSNRGLVL